MAESPSVNKDRVLSCSVYCNGTKLKDTYSLVSATVRLELKVTTHCSNQVTPYDWMQVA